jgi:hypothetical protein
MKNFRDFEIGPDPFGQKWHAQFKYLQTAISIRHSDSVDVRYQLESGSEHMARTIVIPNAEIRAYAKRTGRLVSDPWCSRIAMCKLKHVIETAEDIEKDYILVTPAEIEEYDAQIKKWEEDWLKTHAA